MVVGVEGFYLWWKKGRGGLGLSQFRPRPTAGTAAMGKGRGGEGGTASGASGGEPEATAAAWSVGSARAGSVAVFAWLPLRARAVCSESTVSVWTWGLDGAGL